MRFCQLHYAIKKQKHGASAFYLNDCLRSYLIHIQYRRHFHLELIIRYGFTAYADSLLRNDDKITVCSSGCRGVCMPALMGTVCEEEL